MSWQNVEISKIGYTYTGLSNKKADDFGIGKPYITYMNIFANSKIDKTLFDFVRIDKGENQNKVKYGDVFFTTSSETPDEVGMSSVLLEEVSETYLNSFCFGFRLFDFEQLKPKFAQYYFRSDDFRKKMVYLAQGSTRYNLSKTSFMKCSITIPINPKEQEKIADVLGVLDSNLASTKAIIEKLKLVKQGLMQDLLTRGIDKSGKLRPTYAEAPHLYKQSKLGFVPIEWEVCEFASISKVRQGLQISIKERYLKNNTNDLYQYITIDYLNKGTTCYYVKSPQSSVICDYNDILMTRTGDTGTVITNVRGVFHNNFFLVDYDRNKISKNYLFHYLDRKVMKTKFINYSGTTTIPDLNHKDFYNTFLTFPKDQTEQTSIANHLTTMDEKIQAEQKYLDKLNLIKKGLMQDLLTGKVRCKF